MHNETWMEIEQRNRSGEQENDNIERNHNNRDYSAQVEIRFVRITIQGEEGDRIWRRAQCQ